jgi:large subunit ribosomal protein L13
MGSQALARPAAALLAPQPLSEDRSAAEDRSDQATDCDYTLSPVRTFSPKPSDVQRAWHIVDAEGLVLGRMSTEVARLLRGKHKPIYAPHLDTGDHVIVVNASKVVLTSGKEGKKIAYRHSGYPGGLKQRSYTEIMANNPEDAVRKAVRGMLPKGPLGRSMIKKLKIYAGPTHPHAAQLPEPLELAGAVARQRGV